MSTMYIIHTEPSRSTDVIYNYIKSECTIVLMLNYDAKESSSVNRAWFLNERRSIFNNTSNY